MTRSQKIIIGAMCALVLLVFAGIVITTLARFQQNTAPQVAIADTATPFPTVVFPPTYTPKPSPPPNTPVLSITRRKTARAGTPVPRSTLDPNNPNAVAIDAALKKSRAATAMQFEMDFSMEGDFGSNVPAEYIQDGRARMFTMTAKTKNRDSHIILSGMLAGMLGANSARGIEFINVNRQTYIRGPIPLMGIPDDKWYVASGANQSASGELNPDDIMSGVTDVDWNAISKIGTERLDNVDCDVYYADQTSTLRGLESLGGNPNDFSSDFDAANIEKAETKFWLCKDGYFHQMLLQLQAKNKRASSETVGMFIKIHMYDFDGSFEITPPDNAIPFDGSKWGFATPTQQAD